MSFSISLKKMSLIGIIICGVMVMSFPPLFAQETKTPAEVVKSAPAPPVAASATVPVEDKPTGDITVAAMSQYLFFDI